jgi:cold shock CspA family protein
MSDTTSQEVYLGRVKWFNNKTGYGFATVIDGPCDCDKIGTDIFAHHSSINVAEEQYKYLVQGEYIEFSISAIDSSADYKFQAVGIRGVKGGMLLCETRNQTRANMTQRPKANSGKARPRGGGPRSETQEASTEASMEGHVTDVPEEASTIA